MAYLAYSITLNIQVIHAKMILFVQEGCDTLTGPTGMSALNMETSPVQMQQNKFSTTRQTCVGVNPVGRTSVSHVNVDARDKSFL